ncbi:hypothetical protein AB0H83_29920 [Dactylosporangium sp. NPDC050688]|uniref:DUF7919 family protein n=1 Tax=Dactylosporangium sp. NPDC050688 TaxID=3157217 RepID=UPI0033FC2B0B
MEYPDLSPYTYYAFPLPMVNVGWLGTARGIPAGPPPDATAVQHLRAASRRLSQVMLGVHHCDWCPRGAAYQGNGEYHYYAPDGTVYAAPEMLLHYVEAHGYHPPQVFLDCLPALDDLPWDGRADHLATLLTDDTADLEDRASVIIDLASWKDPRTLAALLYAAHHDGLAGCAGGDIGMALAALQPCAFAPDLHAEPLPEWVRWGFERALPQP